MDGAFDGYLSVVLVGARSVVAFLAVVGLLVIVHELGHYGAARLVGVRVQVFSVGFGRTLWSRRSRGGTDWRVALVPLGGYVKLEGMEPPAAAGVRVVGFSAKGVAARAAVFAAGPAANLLFAWFVFVVAVAISGAPPDDVRVSSLSAGAPAEVAGLHVGDVVVAIDGQRLSRFADLQEHVRESQGRTLTMDVFRGGDSYRFYVAPALVDGRSIVGLSADLSLRPVAWPQVPGAALRWASSVVSETVAGIRLALSGGARAVDFGGPIKVAQVTGQVASLGFNRLLLLVGFLSINLAVVNLLPVPFLDGGHLVFCALEALLGRPLSATLLRVGNSVGFALIVGAMTFATLNDVLNLQFVRNLVGG